MTTGTMSGLAVVPFHHHYRKASTVVGCRVECSDHATLHAIRRLCPSSCSASFPWNKSNQSKQTVIHHRSRLKWLQSVTCLLLALLMPSLWPSSSCWFAVDCQSTGIPSVAKIGKSSHKESIWIDFGWEKRWRRKTFFNSRMTFPLMIGGNGGGGDLHRPIVVKVFHSLVPACLVKVCSF